MSRLDALRRELADAEAQWRLWAACSALVDDGSEPAVALLLTELHSPVRLRRETAATALGSVVRPEVTVALASVVADDESSDVAEAAQEALEAHGPEAVMPLVEVVRSGRHAVGRWFAAETLGRLGSSDATPVLLQALDDTDGSVRAFAAEALVALKASGLEPRLVLLAQDDPDPFAREMAANLLAGLRRR